MRIGPASTVSTFAARLGARRLDARVEKADRATTPRDRTRDLVPVEAATAEDGGPARLLRFATGAPFLAHLIASTETGRPYHGLGRADPQRATQAYDRRRLERVRLEPGWLVDVAG